MNCSFDSAKSNSSSKEGRSNTNTLCTVQEGGGLSFNDFGRGYSVDLVVKELPQLSLLIHSPGSQLLSFVERATINQELP